jgi:hypothetical protein
VKHVLPTLVTAVLLAVLFYFGSPTERLVPNGMFALSIAMGSVVSVCLITPVHLLTVFLVHHLKGAEWTRLVVVGIVYTTVSLAAFLVLPAGITGFTHLSDALRAALMLWLISLPHVACYLALIRASRGRCHQPTTRRG